MRVFSRFILALGAFAFAPCLLAEESASAPVDPRKPYLITDPIAEGPFDGTWSSFTADKLPAAPAWWREAKIGVWFHWGPQTMGRNGDWYARFLYQQPPEGRKGRANGRFMYDEHLRRFGHPSEFGYMDVLNAWRTPALDPEKLVALYAECGARYMLVQGAHHDNFDLWNSPHQPWNSVRVGPHRDIVGEMFAAARRRGFRVGMAFHADYSLWWYQPAFGADKTGPRAGVPYDAATRTAADGKGRWWEGLDPRDLYGIDLAEEALPGKNIRDGFFTPVNDLFRHPATRAFAERYCLKWFRRLKQFVDDYDPDFIYTDGNEPFSGRGTAKGVRSDATARVVSHYYNRRLARHGGELDCMAVIKGGPNLPGVASPKENGYLGPILEHPWVWEDTVGEWFFEENTAYVARPMVIKLIEALCRDGNFQININLTPDGALEPGAEKLWRDFGAFVRAHAEAIYGSRAWRVLGESRMTKDRSGRPALVALPLGGILPEQDSVPMTTEDIRFTVGRDGALYAFVLAVPAPGQVVAIKSLGSTADPDGKPVRAVTLLGAGPAEFSLDADALRITTPATPSPSPYAVCFRIDT